MQNSKYLLDAFLGLFGDTAIGQSTPSLCFVVASNPSVSTDLVAALQNRAIANKWLAA